jgi:acylphosphatase
VNIVVHGVVQGVGFRWFVRERARALRLAGWVRNREDGSVEFTVRGAPSVVDDLIALVKVGPRNARVDRLEMSEVNSAAELPPQFDIHR